MISKKNSSYKRFWCVFLVLVILCTNSILAVEWDNVKNYDEDTKTITINNFFGLPILGTDVAKITLLSDLNEIVPAGYTKVAEFELTLYNDYTTAFKELELYDLKKGNKKFERDFDYRYLTDVEVDVNDYKETCTSVFDVKNLSNEKCTRTISGTHKETKQQWVKLENYDFKDKDVLRIGIFTEVEVGEVVEWIPNFFGVRIDEWATWTQALNVGLVGYWSMDSSNFFDNSSSSNNGTSVNGTVVIEAGMVNNSGNFTGIQGLNFTTSAGADDPLNIITDEFTFNTWLMTSDCSSGMIYSREEHNGSWLGGFRIGISGNKFISEIVTNDYHPFNSNASCETDKWMMITTVYNTTDVISYRDGYITNFSNLTGNIGESNASLHLGYDNINMNLFFNGSLDETGVWNRSLTSAEVATLWNGGAGIPFAKVSVGTTLNSPADNFKTINNSVEFNCSGSSDIGILNLSLLIDDVINQTITNTTANENLTLETTENFIDGGYNWSCSASTADDYVISNTRTFNITSYIQNSETYAANTTENTLDNFTINVSYDTDTYSIVTAELFYNGTSYVSNSSTVAGDSVEFLSTLLIPAQEIAQNVSFNWILSFTNVTGTFDFNSTTSSHHVSLINASLLNDPYTVNFINFSVYDEETLKLLNSTFSITMNYGISSLIKTLSYENTTEGNSTHSFGFSPAHESFLVEGDVEYEANGYVTKLYTLPSQTLTNGTTNISLYLLNSSDSTSFVVRVRDSSYSSVVGAVIHVQRYYPGIDTWTTTEILTTNNEGKGIGHFVTEDVNYRFLVYVDGVLELTSTSTKVFCEVSPCTITLTLPGDTTFVEWKNLSNLDYTLSYSKTTEVFTYNYIDTNDSAEGGRLIVIRSSFYNSTVDTLCDDSDSAATAVITCDISGERNGTYYAFAYNNRSSVQKLINTLIIQKTRNIIGNIGLDGILWTVFLILGIVMIGLFKPAVAIVFAIAGVIFVSVLGLASIPILSVVSIIIMGGFLLWGMKR